MSGSGKSACLAPLAERLPDLDWRDFDTVGVPEGADAAWCHGAVQVWLRRVLERPEAGLDSGVVGQVAYGELLASPPAADVDGVPFCLLDVADVVRIDRLRAGGDARSASQDMLNWAAWNRMHAADPEWRPDVVRGSGRTDMRWERWADWRRGDPRWRVRTVRHHHPVRYRGGRGTRSLGA